MRVRESVRSFTAIPSFLPCTVFRSLLSTFHLFLCCFTRLQFSQFCNFPYSLFQFTYVQYGSLVIHSVCERHCICQNNHFTVSIYFANFQFRQNGKKVAHCLSISVFVFPSLLLHRLFSPLRCRVISLYCTLYHHCSFLGVRWLCTI